MKKIALIVFLFIMACLQSKAFNGNSFDKPIQACVSHILVQSEADAIKIKSDIKTYEDFQQYAKMYSDCPSARNGGYLGCFGHGQMVKPFEQAAFTGEIGEVTGPVKTKFGYHLLWITRRY